MLVEKGRFGLAFQLSQLQNSLFRGRLDVESPSGLRWSLYFCLGRLVWQSGGAYPLDHWNRLLRKHYPKINPQELPEIKVKESQFNGYAVLSELLQQDKNNYSQSVALVQDALANVLFDILQDEYCLKVKQPDVQLSFTIDASDYIKSVFTLVQTDRSLKEAMQQWELWKKMKLASYSPNLIPIIQRPKYLLQNLKNSQNNYETWQKLLDGKRTIRSLALELNQPLPSLTLFFVRYVNSGIMSFLDFKNTEETNPKTYGKDIQKLPSMKDSKVLPPNPTQEDSQNHPLSASTSSIPLVICIDDSPTVCTQVKQIVLSEGYRFLEIQDAVKAIPTLLKIKPDLIFLDLMMPIVNGYEVCAQIRRISIFTDIPIVILTGKDGLVDRVRAKIVGANDFLAKPVKQEQLSSILFKYMLNKLQSN